MVDDLLLYEAITSVQFLSLSSLPIISSFCGNVKSYMFPLASSTLFTHLWIFWSHCNGSNKE